MDLEAFLTVFVRTRPYDNPDVSFAMIPVQIVRDKRVLKARTTIQGGC